MHVRLTTFLQGFNVNNIIKVGILFTSGFYYNLQIGIYNLKVGVYMNRQISYICIQYIYTYWDQKRFLLEYRVELRTGMKRIVPCVTLSTDEIEDKRIVVTGSRRKERVCHRLSYLSWCFLEHKIVLCKSYLFFPFFLI